MKRLLFILVLFFLFSCAPPVNSNQEISMTKNIGDGISIFHDDIHGATCYIIESQITTIAQMVGGTGFPETNYIRSISCIPDIYLVNVE